MGEYLLFISIGLFAASYALNFIAGPVAISIKHPFQFFDFFILSRYPLTSVEIIIKALAIISAMLFLTSLIEKKFLLKSIIFTILSGIGFLYSLQQLANQGRLTPIQWTISFALTSLFSLPFIFYFLIRGIVEGIFFSFKKEKNKEKLIEESLDS